MQPIEFKEDSFKPDSFSDYRISIQYSLNGFSFCLKENKSGIIPYFKFHPLSLSNETGLIKKIGQLLKEESVFNQSFTGADVLAGTGKFTLVPANFFDQMLLPELFEFNHGPTSGSEIFFTNQDNIGMVLLFSIQTALKNVFEKYLENPVFYHILTPLLNYGTFLTGQSKRFGIICFSNSGFFLLIFDNTKPVFINFFEQFHTDNLSFFILTVLKQLNMDSDRLKLFFCGEIERIPDLRILTGLEPMPEFIRSIPGDKSGRIINHIPFHKFFGLLN